MRQLHLSGIAWTEPAALEALADALLARTCRVETLQLWNGRSLSAAYLPALARLLAGRDGAALAEVFISESKLLFATASEADIELVCAALRRTTLTYMQLVAVGLSEQNEAALRQAAAVSQSLRLYLR